MNETCAEYKGKKGDLISWEGIVNRQRGKLMMSGGEKKRTADLRRLSSVKRIKKNETNFSIPVNLLLGRQEKFRGGKDAKEKAVGADQGSGEGSGEL